MSVKIRQVSVGVRLSTVIFALIIIGCSGNEGKDRPTIGISGHYSGAFPCADCSALKIDLTLKPDSSYVIKRTYVAAPNGDTSFVTNGIWEMRIGNKYDPDAVLCVLNPGDSTRFQLFKVLLPDTLLQLDRKGRKINSPFNASLVRGNGQ